MTDLIKEIAAVFPGCRIIIETPDRSDPFRSIIEALKQSGITGIWRVRRGKR